MLREAYQSWLPTVIQLTRSSDQNHSWSDMNGETLLHPLTTIRRSLVPHYLITLSYFSILHSPFSKVHILLVILMRYDSALPAIVALRIVCWSVLQFKTWLIYAMAYRGVERGFKGKSFPRLAKIVLSATLTQDPSKLSQLELQHPLLLNSGKKRYRIPTKLQSYKLVCPHLYVAHF